MEKLKGAGIVGLIDAAVSFFLLSSLCYSCSLRLLACASWRNAKLSGIGERRRQKEQQAKATTASCKAALLSCEK